MRFSKAVAKYRIPILILTVLLMIKANCILHLFGLLFDFLKRSDK